MSGLQKKAVHALCVAATIPALIGILAVISIVALLGAQAVYAHPLDLCPPGMPPDIFCQMREIVATPPPLSAVMTHYLWLGYTHILPKGADHIAFIMALFFSSKSLARLLWLITAFTLAHSLTLALAVMGYVAAPAEIVEPLIALSIAFVAVENFFMKATPIVWRGGIVFLFGLAHGLGFAGILSELGLSQERFFASLVAFNIGVELGQVTIVAGCFLLLSRFFTKGWYRSYIQLPCSALIGLTGLYWFVTRLPFWG